MEALENIEALLGGTDYDMEYRIITKSGLVKFLHEKTKTIYDEDGISIKIIGVIQDITEVKELNKVIAYKEKEIHNVEKRYENIIKESKEGFIIIDSNGIIRYSSFSVEKIIGYTSEEMLNTIIYKIFKGEEIEVIKNMLEYVSKNPEKSIGADVLFTTKYGKEIYMEIYITNLIHEPCIRGILLHCSDVTKKIKIQKQLIYDVNHDKRTGLKSRFV